MKKRTSPHVALSTLAALLAFAVAGCAPQVMGSKLATSPLPGTDGATHALEPAEGTRLTVLFFFANHCPCQAAHDARLRELYALYHPRGVDMFAVDSEIERHPRARRGGSGEARLPVPDPPRPRRRSRAPRGGRVRDRGVRRRLQRRRPLPRRDRLRQTHASTTTRPRSSATRSTTSSPSVHLARPRAKPSAVRYKPGEPMKLWSITSLSLSAAAVYALLAACTNSTAAGPNGTGSSSGSGGGFVVATSCDAGAFGAGFQTRERRSMHSVRWRRAELQDRDSCRFWSKTASLVIARAERRALTRTPTRRWRSSLDPWRRSWMMARCPPSMDRSSRARTAWR